MSRSVEAIVQDIAATTRVSNTELDSLHPNVRPGFEMAIREARENLVRLRKEYRDRIFAQAVAFFLAGDKEQAATFTELAQKLGNVFVVDAGALYRQLADLVEPTIGRSREFSVNQLQEVLLGVRKIAVDAGLKVDPSAIRLKDLRTVADRAALVDYVQELVTDAFGESLNTIYLEQKLIDEALARKFEGNVLAAVVVNATPMAVPTLAQPFSTKTDVTIGTEDEVNEAFVLKVFETGKKNRQKRR